MSKILFTKSRFSVKNKGHRKPVLNFWTGKLWFNMPVLNNMVKQGYKDVVKAFPMDSQDSNS